MDNIVLSTRDLDTVIKEIVDKVVESIKKNENTPVVPNSPIWMDLNELRQYLPDKPAKMTIYGWVQKGKIPVNKSSKKLTFLKADIDLWLMNDRKVSTKPSHLRLKIGKS